jgi:hypothetical protein
MTDNATSSRGCTVSRLGEWMPTIPHMELAVGFEVDFEGLVGAGSGEGFLVIFECPFAAKEIY